MIQVCASCEGKRSCSYTLISKTWCRLLSLLHVNTGPCLCLSKLDVNYFGYSMIHINNTFHLGIQCKYWICKVIEDSNFIKTCCFRFDWKLCPCSTHTALKPRKKQPSLLFDKHHVENKIKRTNSKTKAYCLNSCRQCTVRMEANNDNQV